MRAVVLVLTIALATTSPASRADYQSVTKKFSDIAKQKLRPGTRVRISSPELNAYVQTELPKVSPGGVRNPVVELLGDNTASGTALIDFVRLRSAQGKPPGFLFRTLLQGEHELSVTASIRSGGGTATVDLKTVELAGVPISGGALDFLIQNYLRPNYPDAKIGQPFRLGYRIDRIEVSATSADVVTR